MGFWKDSSDLVMAKIKNNLGNLIVFMPQKKFFVSNHENV